MFDPNVLIHAYCQGYFPMAHPESGNEIYWHLPEQRGIIPLDENFKVSKNLKRLYKQNKFSCRMNENFEKVIRHCAQRPETWISDEIIDMYCQLHEMGVAHSVETYLGNELVGGLYGLSISKAFFGESMFHLVTDASKIALVHLVEHLREKDFILLDSQYLNDHIRQFGAYEVTHEEYLSLLNKALM
ncbi:MAG: leucyl/phenylalanyl-tRNA--protein transferase [Flavobacteriales bacterium]|nr:leucyl/phenylalanyl-tRNA--protein transferase [Flavobacteriales bacterium]